MSEYYGVNTSSSDFFMHYGVRGMKWGVRKAIEKGGSEGAKALSKQYSKALKKAKKLNTKANLSRSQQEYKGRIADAASIGVPAAVAGLASVGLKAMENKHGFKGIGVGISPVPIFTSETGMVLGGLGTAYGGYQLGKGLAAKHRLTQKGHTKAKAKAKTWQNEMKSAFKGTKYSKLPGANKLNKPYEYEPTKTQLKNAAVDTMVYPGYSRNKKIVNQAASKGTTKRKYK